MRTCRTPPSAAGATRRLVVEESAAPSPASDHRVVSEIPLPVRSPFAAEPARAAPRAADHRGLFGPRTDRPGLFDADACEAWLTDVAARTPPLLSPSLERLLGVDTAQLVDRVAEALLTLDGHMVTADVGFVVAARLSTMSKGARPRVRLPTEAIDAFAAQHGDAIRAAQPALRAQRLEADVALVRDAIRSGPAFSLEELRRSLAPSRTHLTRAYVAAHVAPQLADLLVRPVDRMGEEPNLLLAASLARAMQAAAVNMSEECVIAEHFMALPQFRAFLGGSEPGVEHLRALQRAYHFMPNWPLGVKPRMENPLSAEVSAGLDALAAIEVQRECFELDLAHTTEAPLLVDRQLLSVEHPLADKYAFYHYLIAKQGAAGANIDVVWQPYPADPLVVELFDRCLGVKGQTATGEADIAARLRAVAEERLAESRAGPLFFHVGISEWSWLKELAVQHPERAFCVAAHTTADIDGVDGMDLSPLAATSMAGSEAKIRFEREALFGPSFARLLSSLDSDVPDADPPLSSRPIVLHGGLGRIIGSAFLDATFALRARARAEGKDAPFSRVLVVDPAAEAPGQAARVAELRSAGIEVVASDRTPTEWTREPLLVVNASACEVWAPEDFARAECNDVAVMNLGSGERGFAAPWVRAQASTAQAMKSRGDPPTTTYVLERGPGAPPVKVTALADFFPYNLSVPGPNPQRLSAFNNLLILESLRQAQHNHAADLLGMQPLQSMKVIFTEEPEPKPLIVLFDRDAPATIEWQPHWQPVVSWEYAVVPSAALGMVSLRTRWRKELDERVMRLVAWDDEKLRRR